jgi:putative oxidoreductase
LTVVLHFVGSIGIFLGTYVEECAIALALFTVVATLMVHDFWNLEGQERMADQRILLAHFGVVGGLLMVVAVGPGEIVL